MDIEHAAPAGIASVSNLVERAAFRASPVGGPAGPALPPGVVGVASCPQPMPTPATRMIRNLRTSRTDADVARAGHHARAHQQLMVSGIAACSRCRLVCAAESGRDLAIGGDVGFASCGNDRNGASWRTCVQRDARKVDGLARDCAGDCDDAPPMGVEFHLGRPTSLRHFCGGIEHARLGWQIRRTG